jgi:putative flavoprotein involved in K+ transport
MTSVTDVVVIGGGQSGLAAARALQVHGITPLVLEAGAEPAGSWPRYYDSLTLFSPARYSAMPGMDFPGDPDRYPHRDEVVSYLRRYAAGLAADIRTRTPVTAVEARDQGGFLVRTATRQVIRAVGVVAASGSFGNPYLPVLPGQDDFTGRLLHVAHYRSPERHAGERIVVVGAGNSAVQVGYELAQVAAVTRSCSPPATARTWATSPRWAPSTMAACHGTAAASRAPTPAWPTSGWSSSGRSPPTRCAASTATPST